MAGRRRSRAQGDDDNSGRIVLRLPGGVRPDGIGLHIYGTPELAPGGEAIVFLRQREDGTFSLADFPQGAFLGARSAKRRLALRDFSEVKLVSPGRVGAREPMRDFDRFADWIEDRADGFQRSADYLVTPRRSELETITSPFTSSPTATPISTALVRVRQRRLGTVADAHGSDAGALERRRRRVQARLAVDNESTTPVRLAYGGNEQRDRRLRDLRFSERRCCGPIPTTSSTDL
jgi:hypothetical protein